MVSKYVEVFLRKNHLKCLSYTGECHMGSFPQPRHFFAAAQENKDFGALRMGPSMPSKYKLFVDTKNSALGILTFLVF